MENKPGIYAIRNTITDNVYVGSSIRVSMRLSQHRWAMKRGNHVNQHLQASWNKHGENAFTFELLENCEVSVLAEREQFWITKLAADADKGYNLVGVVRGLCPNPKASRERKSRWEGLTLEERMARSNGLVSEENRRSNSERQKERWKDPKYRSQRLAGLAKGREKTNARKNPIILANLAKGRQKAIDRGKNDPARKELQRKVILKIWENPEFRAKMIDNLNRGREKLNAQKKANALIKRAGNDIVSTVNESHRSGS